jgi:hypothetical protein
MELELKVSMGIIVGNAPVGALLICWLAAEHTDNEASLRLSLSYHLQ